MNALTAAVIVAVVLAFAGCAAAYARSLRSSRRSEQLELVNRRINDLYGPLYVVSSVGDLAHRALAAKLEGADGTRLRKPLDEEEYNELRLWVTHVLMPMYERCERLLLDNASLMVEREVPECLLQFMAHVSGYKVVVEKWADDNFTEWDSTIEYPAGLKEYAARTYLALKDEQLRLTAGR